MDLGLLANNATPSDSGVWKTPSTVAISYTENGHDLIKDKEQNSFWFAHRLRCLTKVINRYPPKILLDIGGGNGQFSKHVQSMNVETILLEPGTSGAYNALKNGVQHVINGSLQDAAFKNSSVDTISILDVLEHIEGDEQFLKEIHRILEVDGKLILTVPAYQFLYSDFDKEVGHYRRYTLKNLKQKLKNTGFEIEYRSYLFSFIPLPLLFGRLVLNKFKKKENRKATGHVKKSGLMGHILAPLLWIERGFIQNKLRIPMGSSCLVVAKKTHHV